MSDPVTTPYHDLFTELMEKREDELASTRETYRVLRRGRLLASAFAVSLATIVAATATIPVALKVAGLALMAFSLRSQWQEARADFLAREERLLNEIAGFKKALDQAPVVSSVVSARIPPERVYELAVKTIRVAAESARAIQAAAPPYSATRASRGAS